MVQVADVEAGSQSGSSGGASGVRAQQLEGPALPADPTRSRSRDVLSSSETTGAPLAEPFVSIAFWEARSSAHAKRVLPNSSSSQFGKSAAPPTHPIIHGFGF